MFLQEHNLHRQSLDKYVHNCHIYFGIILVLVDSVLQSSNRQREKTLRVVTILVLVDCVLQECWEKELYGTCVTILVLVDSVLQ